MASPQCEGKVRHPTEKDAKAAIRYMPERTGPLVKLVPYRCRQCGGWHVGNTEYSGRDRRAS